MSLIEIYLAEDGSIFKKNPFQGDATFFTRLSDEELRSLTDLLCSKNTSKKGKAGPRTRRPAADFGARTGTNDDDIRGSDYLQNDYQLRD